MKGCTLIEGHARFEAPDRLRVGADLLTAPRIFVNVGGRPSVPPLPGIDDVPFLTNRTMLDLDQVPEHLLVVGGSYIGLEFAQMHRRFGAKVTIVERLPHLIAREDADISEAIREILIGEGVAVRTGAECIRLGRHEGGVAVFLDCAEGEPTVVGIPRAPRGGPTAQYRRPRAGRRRSGDRCARLHHRRRFPGHERPRDLGAGRLQRPRRLHAHRLQRLRDRGRQPARRRPPPRLGPGPRLCPLHRPAPRPRGR